MPTAEKRFPELARAVGSRGGSSRPCNRLLPRLLNEIFAFLYRPESLDCPGIGRELGNLDQVASLKRMADGGKPLKLCRPGRRAPPPPHSICSLLKLYLRDLPEPIIPPHLFTALTRLANARGRNAPLLRGFLDLLTPVAREVLAQLVAWMRAVCERSAYNGMTPETIAQHFASELVGFYRGDPEPGEVIDLQPANSFSLVADAAEILRAIIVAGPSLLAPALAATSAPSEASLDLSAPASLRPPRNRGPPSDASPAIGGGRPPVTPIPYAGTCLSAWGDTPLTPGAGPSADEGGYEDDDEPRAWAPRPAGHGRGPGYGEQLAALEASLAALARAPAVSESLSARVSSLTASASTAGVPAAADGSEGEEGEEEGEIPAAEAPKELEGVEEGGEGGEGGEGSDESPRPTPAGGTVGSPGVPPPAPDGDGGDSASASPPPPPCCGHAALALALAEAQQRAVALQDGVELRDELRRIEAQCRDLREEAERLREEGGQLRRRQAATAGDGADDGAEAAEIAALRKDKDELRVELATIRREKDEQLAALRADRDAVLTEGKAAAAETRAALARVQELENEREAYRRIVEDYRKERCRMEGDLTKYKANVEDLARTLQQMRNEAGPLRAAHEAVVREKTELESALRERGAASPGGGGGAAGRGSAALLGPPTGGSLGEALVAACSSRGEAAGGAQGAAKALNKALEREQREAECARAEAKAARETAELLAAERQRVLGDLAATRAECEALRLQVTGSISVRQLSRGANGGVEETLAAVEQVVGQLAGLLESTREAGGEAAPLAEEIVARVERVLQQSGRTPAPPPEVPTPERSEALRRRAELAEAEAASLRAALADAARRLSTAERTAQQWQHRSRLLDELLQEAKREVAVLRGGDRAALAAADRAPLVDPSLPDTGRAPHVHTIVHDAAAEPGQMAAAAAGITAVAGMLTDIRREQRESAEWLEGAVQRMDTLQRQLAESDRSLEGLVQAVLAEDGEEGEEAGAEAEGRPRADSATDVIEDAAAEPMQAPPSPPPPPLAALRAAPSCKPARGSSGGARGPAPLPRVALLASRPRQPPPPPVQPRAKPSVRLLVAPANAAELVAKLAPKPPAGAAAMAPAAAQQPAAGPVVVSIESLRREAAESQRREAALRKQVTALVHSVREAGFTGQRPGPPPVPPPEAWRPPVGAGVGLPA